MELVRKFQCFYIETIYLFEAICSFTASSPDQLSLLLGDSVHIREECDGKYYYKKYLINYGIF